MNENLIYCVYAIRCKNTGRMYIGCTTNLQGRLRQHFLDLQNHKKVKYSNVHKRPSGTTWQDDYDKYGEDSFEVYVLEENVLHKDKFSRETYWIRKYDTRNYRKGYNTVLSKKVTYDIKKGLPPMQTEKEKVHPSVNLDFSWMNKLLEEGDHAETDQ